MAQTPVALTSVEERAAKARQIVESPDEFQVCEGCESIVASGVTICPNCHSYRFDDSATRVVEQALVLGSREQQSVTVADLQ